MNKYLTIVMVMASLFCCSITLTTYGQCSNAPVLTSVTPNTGFVGSTVTISGAFFDPVPANNQVWFGATRATILTSSFGSMTVTVPIGATTSLVSVKNSCNKIAYSKVPFNGIFCPTPLTTTTYQNVAFTLSGIVGSYNMMSQDIDGDGKPDIISEGFGSNFTIARNTSTPGSLRLSGCRTDSSLKPPLAPAKAIHLPSGDQAQCASLPGRLVNRFKSVPSGLIV